MPSRATAPQNLSPLPQASFLGRPYEGRPSAGRRCEDRPSERRDTLQKAQRLATLGLDNAQPISADLRAAQYFSDSAPRAKGKTRLQKLLGKKDRPPSTLDMIAHEEREIRNFDRQIGMYEADIERLKGRFIACRQCGDKFNAVAVGKELEHCMKSAAQYMAMRQTALDMRAALHNSELARQNTAREKLVCERINALNRETELTDHQEEVLVTLRTAQDNTKVVGEQITAQGADLDTWLAQVEANLESRGPSESLPSEVMAPMHDPIFSMPSYPAVPLRAPLRPQAVATADPDLCIA
jgi:hypothetical protein